MAIGPREEREHEARFAGRKMTYRVENYNTSNVPSKGGKGNGYHPDPLSG